MKSEDIHEQSRTSDDESVQSSYTDFSNSYSVCPRLRNVWEEQSALRIRDTVVDVQ